MKKLVLTAALLASANAGAATLEGDWYGRVNFGITDPDAGELEGFVHDTIESEMGVSESVDFENPRSYSINIGYRINNYVAVEAGYTNFGEHNVRYSYPNYYGNLATLGYEGRETDTYKAEISGSTRTLGVVLSTDASRQFSAGVRAGISLWNTRAEVNYVYDNITRRLIDPAGSLDADNIYDTYSNYQESRLSSDLSGEDAYFGAFVSWRIGRWAYTLDHTLYKTDEVEPMVSSLALDYAF
ncbi:outer membrane beta-barrel protein [Microbulbifer hainanensis]|uniref:outer membrane beta-barrel protein n=1 Tax=Microbulbifer hainanensis TaxID=2735675 RepID=UPI0018666E1F|nr:outer membrane beta-barrel protein [Microbulbifer hainanensis]